MLVFEARQIDVAAADQDLHYVVRDPGTGAALAEVAPVAVDEVAEERTRQGRFARLRRAFTPGIRAPGEALEVPRVVLRVADPGGATVFFLDRARKLSGNRFPPQWAVVGPDGGVLGFVTNDHRASFRAPDLAKGPFDADGACLVSGRNHLRAANHEVLCDVVVRMSASEPVMRVLASPGADRVRYVGRDGALWGRLTGESMVLDCDPRLPWPSRALLIAGVVAGRADERLHTSLLMEDSYVPPAPLRPAGEPYARYGGMHDRYMAYQAEFIEWYEKETRRIARGAAAYASD
ncbi:hypothetical protein [Actinomadura sp. 21ATH]|uniref:hypothetical protein n=1 Tax=Actinomadura sp. 21ATH TaxID=1735444 RepID=UPI0035BEF96B